MSEFHALVPAAGLGERMGGETPKQYLSLAGKPMLYHALDTLCSCVEIATVFVVLAPNDKVFHTHDWSRFDGKLRPLFCGGNRRSDTVLNGLLASELEPDDWVLVHDAARLEKLIAELRDDPVGGILAVPVADTLKREDEDGRIARSEDRKGIWQAQTPQMFRAGLLTEGLQRPGRYTDEASAIEAMGMHPALVPGESVNFKVTYPQDMLLAELLLAQ